MSSAVDIFIENLPLLSCKTCGCAEFTIDRARIIMHGTGEIVVNRLKCFYCDEVVTVLP